MLLLENIKGGYSQNHNILHGVELEIKQGKTLAVIGQNGAGKSTLAKAIVNTLPHKTGKIYFNNNEITAKTVQQIINSGLGYFLQGGQTFPHLTIKENILFAAGNINKADFENRFKELKQYFEFLNNVDLKIQASYLSGGEKHQLALLMVLFQKPTFLILDEPSAGLSPSNVKVMYNTLHKLKQQNNLTILLIEQNVEKAIEFADSVALLKIGMIEKILQTNKVKTIEDINKFYFS